MGKITSFLITVLAIGLILLFTFFPAYLLAYGGKLLAEVIRGEPYGKSQPAGNLGTLFILLFFWGGMIFILLLMQGRIKYLERFESFYLFLSQLVLRPVKTKAPKAESKVNIHGKPANYAVQSYDDEYPTWVQAARKKSKVETIENVAKKIILGFVGFFILSGLIGLITAATGN